MSGWKCPWCGQVIPLNHIVTGNNVAEHQHVIDPRSANPLSGQVLMASESCGWCGEAVEDRVFGTVDGLAWHVRCLRAADDRKWFESQPQKQFGLSRIATADAMFSEQKEDK